MNSSLYVNISQCITECQRNFIDSKFILIKFFSALNDTIDVKTRDFI